MKNNGDGGRPAPGLFSPDGRKRKLLFYLGVLLVGLAVWVGLVALLWVTWP